MTATTCQRPAKFPFGVHVGLQTYPQYPGLRAREPVCRVVLPYGGEAWLVTTHGDAAIVLGDARFSRAASVGRDMPRQCQRPAMQVALVDSDPPEHTRLRNLVAWAFTPRRVKLAQPRIERRSAELIAAMRSGPMPADLVSRYAVRLPVAVICDLLGIPEADHELLCSWADAAVSSSALSDEEQMRFYAEVGAYMADLIKQRRERPGDDLISALVQARDEGRITEHELLELAVVVLVAGNDTTASQLANCAFVLLDSPGHWRQLRADPDLIPAAVEELVRFIPLSSGILQPRVATEDVELSGQCIRAGDVVLVALESANRDEAVFADGDDLVLARQPNPHLGYSHGPHYCLGAALARRELQVAVRHWTDQLPGLRLAVPADEVRWKTGLLVRGPVELPVAW